MDFDKTVSKLKAYLPAYLAEKLGIDPAHNFRCPFPDHNDSTPSAGIVGLDTSSPRVHCLGCGRSGDLFDMVVLLEKKPAVGREWMEETLRYLADKYEVELDLPELTPEQIYELDIYRAYRAAASLIRSSGTTSETFREAVRERGWNTEIMEENHVGTVESFQVFRTALRKKGFPVQFLDEIDLSRKDLFNEENLIFTWKDDKGRPIGFTARNLNWEKQVQEAEVTGIKPGPKYNNQRTTGLKCNIFQKGSRLYGIDSAIKSTPPLYLFEGQADVLTARHHGLRNCVAIAGGDLGVEHIHLLQKLDIRDIIIAFDGDQPGQKKNMIGVERFSGFRDMKVRVLALPESEDPDSFIRRYGVEKFKSLPILGSFEYRLTKFPSETPPEYICEVMIPLIVNEVSAVRKDQFCKILASNTGVSLIAIREELNALLDEKSRERATTRREIIDRTKWSLDKSPTDAEQTLIRAQIELQEFNQQHNSNLLSCESFVSSIQELKDKEEDPRNIDTSFELGPDLEEFREWLRGEWTDTFIVVGGKENSGKCLSSDTNILLSDGRYKTIEEITQNQINGIIKMDTSHRLVHGKITQWINSGKLPCYQVIVEDGVEITVSETHPFYTSRGWVEVKDLKSDDQIAIVGNLSCFSNLNSPISSNEAIFLAGLIAEGNLHNRVGFCNSEEEIINYFKEATDNVFPGINYSFRDNITSVVDLNRSNNRALDYLREVGLANKNSYEKFIPDSIFQCGPKVLSKFLGMLWACDGWISKGENIEAGISFCNKTLIKQVRSLLLRFGIRSRIASSVSWYDKEGEKFPRHSLHIGDTESLKKFYNNIRIPCSRKQQVLKEFLSNKVEYNGAYSDNLPATLWESILKNLNKMGWSLTKLGKLLSAGHSQLGYDNSKDRFKTMSPYSFNTKAPIPRKIARSIGYLIRDDKLISLSEGDIYFDAIKSIAFVGEKQCYDLEILEDHNFIAEDFIVHNTALLCKLAWEIVTRNENVVVIYHSIDDTLPQIFPRLVCLASGDHSLTLNQVRQPNYWKEIVEGLEEKRSYGYARVLDEARKGKLVVKDIGTTLSFAENLIRHHQTKNPDARIIYILDNFHKLTDLGGYDERIRNKLLSQMMKNMVTRNHITALASVEYTKLSPGIKPTKSNILETGQVAYDANFICHLYSEMADLPDSFQNCHYGTNWKGETVPLPRIEMLVDKNKITERKGHLFFDFWPANSNFRMVKQSEVVNSKPESKGGFITK